LFLACLCSCAKYEADRAADYIGPKASEPNTLTAAEGLNPPSATRNLPSQEGPLQVSVEQATLVALENNRSLVVQRFEPQITRTFVQEGLAAFDPILTGQLAYQDSRIQGPDESEFSGPSAAIGVQEFLPTGTSLGLTGTTAPTTFIGPVDESDYASRIAFNATQSLLQGFGPAVNLASVNQAKIDVQISQYELRGFAQTLVAQIEETYWDYVAAERRIGIFSQSLDLAQKQLEETRERIRVGDLAATELSAAEAEVALRRENLINARSTLAKTKLDLLRLVNPPGANLWGREVVLTSPPTSLAITLDDVETHVALALQMRPDLNQARLLYQRDELEVVKTRNGLLPRLDLFVTLGRTGFADSFGRSVENLGDNNYDALVGLNFEYPPWNRGAQARQLRAVLTRRQTREAIGNLAQLVEVDVRSAYVEVARAQEQVLATAATRRLQEEKLRVETEKFRLGKSTSLLVGQAQRDLLVSQIEELQTVISHLKSFVDLYRLEGSLLERRGIAGPGREPVKGPDVP
jgi:outer membrane protein TolC